MTQQYSVGIVGLGSKGMGMGMAKNVLGTGIAIKGFDVFEGSRTAFAAEGGETCDSAEAAAKGVNLLMLMVVNAQQAEDVLFGSGNALSSLPKGATVMLCSTVAPSEARNLGEKVLAAGLNFLDAPVSGGKVGAEAGALTIMASGSAQAFEVSEPVLSAVSKVVHNVGETPGLGATYKVVHQLAAGVHWLPPQSSWRWAHAPVATQTRFIK